MKKNIYIFHHNVEIFKTGYGTSYFVPYIYGILRAHAERDQEIKDNYEWQLPFYLGDDIQEYLDLVVDPTIMGFSCYLWNWERVLFLSRLVKEKFPKCLIVFGGPQVPLLDDNFFKAHPWVDIIVQNEGEEKFTQILKERLKENPNYKLIQGLSVNDNLIRFRTPDMPKLNLQEAPPSPLVLGYFDKYLVQLKAAGRRPALSFESNRGCPFSCSFCDWGSATSSKVRLYTEKRMLDEIERACSDEYVFISGADANFGMFSLDVKYTQAFVDGLKKYGFPFEMRMNMAKNSNERVIEIGELIQKNFPLIRHSTLSVQSMSPTVLKNIKRENIGLSNYVKLNDIYKSKNVLTYSELILGLPGETLKSWLDGLGQLAQLGVNEIALYPFMVVANAPIALDGDVEKFDIKLQRIERSDQTFTYQNKTYHEYAEIVTSTSSMSTEDYYHMIIFFHIIDLLHFKSFIGTLATYLTHEHKVSIATFYQELFMFYYKNTSSFFGSTVNYISDRIKNEPDSVSTNSLGLCKISNNQISTEDVFTVNNFICTTFVLNIDTFMSEVKGFINHGLGISDSDSLLDAIAFQKFEILKPLNTLQPIENVFHYDWLSYKHNKVLIREELRVMAAVHWRAPAKMNENLFFIKLKTSLKMLLMIKKPIPILNEIKIKSA